MLEVPVTAAGLNGYTSLVLTFANRCSAANTPVAFVRMLPVMMSK